MIKCFHRSILSTPLGADARGSAANASSQVITVRNAQLGAGESGDNKIQNFLVNELHREYHRLHHHFHHR